MKLKNLVEEFVTYIKDEFNSITPIYKNPSISEVQDLIKEINKERIHKNNHVRFIIYFDTKEVYFFNAEVLHQDVCIELNKPYGLDKGFFGIGEYNPKTKKIEEVMSNYTLNAKIAENMLKKDLSFSQKYFSKPIKEIIIDNSGPMARNNKRTIREEFSTYLKDQWGDVSPIYINPTKSEMREMSKELEGEVRATKDIRFIADLENKKMYVFNYSLLHQKVVKKYDIQYPMNKKVFFGIGEYHHATGTITDIESCSTYGNYPNGEETIKALEKADWSVFSNYKVEEGIKKELKHQQEIIDKDKRRKEISNFKRKKHEVI
jgi:hypothetical protein